MPGPGGANSLNVTLLVDDDGGLTVVDAGPHPSRSYLH
jgi:hypothetical protein